MASSKQRGDLQIIPVPFPDEIHEGDLIAKKLMTALKRNGLRLMSGDVLVVKHKIVSKAEADSLLWTTFDRLLHRRNGRRNTNSMPA